MEREVGRGIGMGNTCKPMAVSFQCMTKFATNKKINKKNASTKKKKRNVKYSFKALLRLTNWIMRENLILFFR